MDQFEGENLLNEQMIHNLYNQSANQQDIMVQGIKMENQVNNGQDEGLVNRVEIW